MLATAARFNQALALNSLYHLFGFHHLKSRRWAVVKTPLSLPAKKKSSSVWFLGQHSYCEVDVEIAGTPLICPSFNNNLRTAGQHGALSCFSLKQDEEMSVSMTATRAVYTLRYILKYMINNRCHLPNQSNSIPNMANSARLRSTTYRHCAHLKPTEACVRALRHPGGAHNSFNEL